MTVTTLRLESELSKLKQHELTALRDAAWSPARPFHPDVSTYT